MAKWGIEYAIEIDEDLLANSVEVARLWVEDGGPATCYITPNSLTSAEMFGMLMVDTIRHGARAYAQYLKIPEEEALARIWDGLETERNQNTTTIKTVQDFDSDDKEPH